METLAKRIVYVRETLLYGISQEEFADKLEVSRGAVGNWETEKSISRANLIKVAALADISLDWLANGVGETPQPMEKSEFAPLTARDHKIIEAAISGMMDYLQVALPASVTATRLHDVIAGGIERRRSLPRITDRPTPIIRPAAPKA